MRCVLYEHLQKKPDSYRVTRANEVVTLSKQMVLVKKAVRAVRGA